MPHPDEERRTLAREARLVAIVIAATVMLWLLAQLLGAEYGWDPSYAFLFDLAALAAFFWALVATWRLWQRGKRAGK